MNGPTPIAAAAPVTASLHPRPALPPMDFQAQEVLIAAYLDPEGQITHILTVNEGEKDRINLSVRAIIQEAFNCNSNRFFLVHNHPSGDPRPSSADIKATRLLCRTTAALDLELVDHVIIAPPACFSFRAAGLL